MASLSDARNAKYQLSVSSKISITLCQLGEELHCCVPALLFRPFEIQIYILSVLLRVLLVRKIITRPSGLGHIYKHIHGRQYVTSLYVREVIIIVLSSIIF